MTAERLTKLEALGFVWQVHKSQWETRFVEFQNFHRQHGHPYVPINYAKNKKLATWVKHQRRNYRKLCRGQPSTMTLDHMERLQASGFEWMGRQAPGRRTAGNRC
mmetsp:Transcript_79334/g.230370  ORF Transcript_79334/g.230370 Transcript_79334/m.230370 type:complete len:105 (+) Transcript_79334:385-699(+)